MSTIFLALKAILAVIGISVLLFNPSFLAAAPKGAPGHQPMIAARKAPAPVPPPNRAIHQKTIKRPKQKIKPPGKRVGASAQKTRLAPKPPVKPPVNQKDKRLVNRQQKPKPDPVQRKTVKPPVNQKDKRLANKQPNLANEKSRITNNLHSSRTIAGTASRGKSTDKQSVHRQGSVINQGVIGRGSNSRQKSEVRRDSTDKLRDMPKPVDVPRTLGGASQTAKLDTRNNKAGDLFGKPAIALGKPNPTQMVSEAGKRNVNRSSDKRPAASTGPRLNPEAASQTNPIHQQKNSKLKEDWETIKFASRNASNGQGFGNRQDGTSANYLGSLVGDSFYNLVYRPWRNGESGESNKDSDVPQPGDDDFVGPPEPGNSDGEGTDSVNASYPEEGADSANASYPEEGADSDTESTETEVPQPGDDDFVGPPEPGNSDGEGTESDSSDNEGGPPTGEVDIEEEGHPEDICGSCHYSRQDLHRNQDLHMIQFLHRNQNLRFTVF